MAKADAATRARLRDAIEHGDTDALPDVVAAINATGGLDYARARAAEYAGRAEECVARLESNAYVAALRGLARYAVQRDH